MKRLLVITIIISLALVTVFYVVIKKPFSKEEEVNNNVSIETQSDFFVEDANGKTLPYGSQLIGLPNQEIKLLTTKECTVTILPNADNLENDFQFTVNGAKKQFFSELNLKKAFTITQSKNEVIITPNFSSIDEMLTLLYAGKEIELQEGQSNLLEGNMFILQISEKGGKAVYNFNLSVIGMKIDIDDEIIF